MSKKASIASILLGSAALAVITGGGRRSTAAPTGPLLPPPAPSNLPPFSPSPIVPDPPWALPPTPPQMVAVKAGRRYEVVADVQGANGVSLSSAAKKILEALQLDDPSLKGYKDVERPGAGEVTRVTLRVTPLVDNSFPIETKMQTPGVGTCWVVSIKEVGP